MYIRLSNSVSVLQSKIDRIFSFLKVIHISMRLNTPAEIQKYLSDRHSVPTIYVLNDYFHNRSAQSMANHSEKTNQTILNATIKHLRSNFETVIREFHEDCLKKIELAETVRNTNIVDKYHHERQLVKTKSDALDIQRVVALPNELIRLIFQFCSDDTKLLFYIGKYSGEAVTRLLNSFKKPDLLRFIPHTKSCYLGSEMPHGKYPQASLKKKRKSELITALYELLSNIEDCHRDPNVITSKSSRPGRVYNIQYYEKHALLLWRHILSKKLNSLPKV